MDELEEIAKGMDSVYLCPDTAASAKAAAACTLYLAAEIARGRLANGFAIVRPPGHHAEPDQVPHPLPCPHPPSRPWGSVS